MIADHRQTKLLIKVISSMHRCLGGCASEHKKCFSMGHHTNKNKVAHTSRWPLKNHLVHFMTSWWHCPTLSNYKWERRAWCCAVVLTLEIASIIHIMMKIGKNNLINNKRCFLFLLLNHLYKKSHLYMVFIQCLYYGSFYRLLLHIKMIFIFMHGCLSSLS